jgi:PEP-CTERM motif
MQIRNRFVRIVAVLVALGLPAAFGTTLNLSTGLDAGGSLITADQGCDAHWVAVAGPATVCSGAAAQVVMPGDADWGGPGWVGNGPNSDWITSNSTSNTNGSPLPTYEVRFYLADTTEAEITGSWTIDDAGDILLNGNLLASLGNGNWGSLHAVSASSGFVAGLNILSIRMTSSDNNIEGVRFEGSVTGDVTTPEPASLALLAGGLLALAFRLRRRAP